MPFTLCPYCHQLVWNYDTTHWHTFGRKGDVVGEYEAFNACKIGIGDGTLGCQYSGDWYGLYPETTNDEYVARYHGHRIHLSSTGGTGSENDYINSWHVGGGVPGWTTNP